MNPQNTLTVNDLSTSKQVISKQILPKHIIPKHIAIIMDGNNRYGKAHALPTGEGHIKGKDALDPIVEHCLKIGVEVLTVFAFSSENWLRPAHEVALLMKLLEQTIHEQIPRMNEYKVRLRFIGDRSQLDKNLQELMTRAEESTAHFSNMTLVIAVSYGGKWDIANASRQLAQLVADGQLTPDEINSDKLGEYTALADVPAVDMLIRTGGDYRLSNFLLWQTAYAELFFTPTLWPQFTVAELDEMITDFSQRQRRFGMTSEQIEENASSKN